MRFAPSPNQNPKNHNSPNKSAFIMPMTSPVPTKTQLNDDTNESTSHEDINDINDVEEGETRPMLSAFDSITSSSSSATRNDSNNRGRWERGGTRWKEKVRGCCLFNGMRCQRIGSSRVCNVSSREGLGGETLQPLETTSGRDVVKAGQANCNWYRESLTLACLKLHFLLLSFVPCSSCPSPNPLAPPLSPLSTARQSSA